MKGYTKKMLSSLFLVLSIAAGFTACTKDDSPDMETPLSNATTTVRLIFIDSSDAQKVAGSKVDLTKAQTVKIKYTVSNDSVGPKIAHEASLLVKGSRTKISTIDQKELTFKSGTDLTIFSADLYDSKSNLLGGWAKDGSDIFEVTSLQGEAPVMDRTYNTVGVEKL
ncbi:hypothetical protein [Flavobacterium sp. ACN6]|uniref:hypothetical protein n=1 Tax=Flavobacterium sp. ACN6 TaxID=1920426 RepID=UPI000BB2DC0F|nr:hypothetical protein [Flavobacterium sp. ACN6]PBJ04607.1 hypothetical protein BSF42_44140 [Flavobacterium sp. ACN6]